MIHKLRYELNSEACLREAPIPGEFLWDNAAAEKLHDKALWAFFEAFFDSVRWSPTSTLSRAAPG